jgi:hypothetical protein
MSDGLTNFQQTGWEKPKENKMTDQSKFKLAIAAVLFTVVFPALTVAAATVFITVLGVILSAVTLFALGCAAVSKVQMLRGEAK